MVVSGVVGSMDIKVNVNIIVLAWSPPSRE
jgi:hypothetical protein